MSYIESHEELVGHPKTLDLMAAMSIDVDSALGKLHRFWYWCMKYAPSGYLDKHPESRIDVLFGRGFVAAAREAGFIDKEQYRVHDWPDYAGRYLNTRFRTRNPRLLAEIFLRYGRLEEAQKVLEAAVKRQLITQAQADEALGFPLSARRLEGATDGENQTDGAPEPENLGQPTKKTGSVSTAKSAPVSYNSTQLTSSQRSAAQPSVTQPPPPTPPPGGGADGGASPGKRPRGAPSPEDLVGFDAFWQLYPNPTNRKAAERSWALLKPDPELQNVILADLRARRAAPPWSAHMAKKTLSFIPRPANYLRDERWKDPIDAPPAREDSVVVDGPPAGDPYQARTPVQHVVCAYKLLKGVEMDDRAWDAAQWPVVEPQARLLLGAFNGDDRAANCWLESYVRDLEHGGVTNWSLRAAASRAWDTRSERGAPSAAAAATESALISSVREAAA